MFKFAHYETEWSVMMTDPSCSSFLFQLAKINLMQVFRTDKLIFGIAILPKLIKRKVVILIVPSWRFTELVSILLLDEVELTSEDILMIIPLFFRVLFWVVLWFWQMIHVDWLIWHQPAEPSPLNNEWLHWIYFACKSIGPAINTLQISGTVLPP